MSKATMKRGPLDVTATPWPPPAPTCPHCGATGTLDAHDPACPYRVRTESYRAQARAREEAARAARAAEPEEQDPESTAPVVDDEPPTEAEEASSRNMARLTKTTAPEEVENVDGLRALAKMLDIPGRSALKTRYDLEAAIKSAQKATAKGNGKANGNGHEPTSGTLDEYQSAEGETFAVGSKVKTNKALKNTVKSSVYKGAVDEGAAGVVVAIRGAGGPNGGGQLVVDLKGLGEITSGARNFTLA